MCWVQNFKICGSGRAPIFLGKSSSPVQLSLVRNWRGRWNEYRTFLRGAFNLVVIAEKKPTTVLRVRENPHNLRVMSAKFLVLFVLSLSSAFANGCPPTKAEIEACEILYDSKRHEHLPEEERIEIAGEALSCFRKLRRRCPNYKDPTQIQNRSAPKPAPEVESEVSR